MLENPLQMLSRTAYERFMFWWSSCLPRYRAGQVVSLMWETFPFGALSPDSDWCWWSLDQVARDGVELAGQLGCTGLAIAECRQGVAVLSWPHGSGTEAVVLMAAFQKAGDTVPGVPAALDPQRFLKAKGFADLDRIIPCAILSKQPYVTASPKARDVWPNGHKNHLSEQARANESARSASARQ